MTSYKSAACRECQQRMLAWTESDTNYNKCCCKGLICCLV